MCTSLAFKTNDFYFGRNMDLDYHFGERVVVTPRDYKLPLKHHSQIYVKHAMIGMATVQNEYPLYAEGVNEKGLCISALNFEGNAYYGKPITDKLSLASYEIIPYILATCATADEAEKVLKAVQITDTPFSDDIGVSPLHWHIADKTRSIVLESTKEGIKIHENPVGVLTNNPPFDFHLKTLSLYNHLKPKPPADGDTSLGLSMLGLPGDFSSPSRFIRLSILSRITKCNGDEKESLATLLRLMLCVSPLKGTTLTKDEKDHYTTYTCLINATKGIYYWTSSMSLEINSVNLKNHLFDKSLFVTPFNS